MAEQLIKDNPDLVKDSKSGAILLKRQKTINNIEIENLKRRVNELEFQIKSLLQIVTEQNKIISEIMRYINY